LGKKLSTLQWDDARNEGSEAYFPWQRVLSTGKSSIGVHLTLISTDFHSFKFAINATPILSANEVTQGVLITLDDITELEERNMALQTTVSRLEEAQSQVEQQNKELNFLATKDPLTGCLNRRSFNEQFESAFKKAQQDNSELSCFMADLDHFKAVNDTYGHAVGDAVIKLFAEMLQANTRKIDLVGRYGGEEFCVVTSGLSAEEVVLVAERIRSRLKDESVNRFENGPHVTASFGVASLKDNPLNPFELQNFADEALYVAKQSGRNQVVRRQPNTEHAGHIETKTDLVHGNKPEDIGEGTSGTAMITKLQQRINELEGIASQFSADLEYTKNYDAVTCLPNQGLFYDQIWQVIERGNRYNQLAAIVVIDIGMLSQINTALGRNAGDKLLTDVAERLKSVLRKYDVISRLNISRFGGDVFAVLLTDLPTKEAVTWIANRLLDALLEPVDIDGNSVFLASHLGISLYPSDSSSVDDLINNAIIAKKYSQKYHTESHYQFFDEDMQKLSIKHVKLDKELRDSILYENWVLLYQPKMDINTKVIVGVEALIRWQHPTRGLLSPYEFIEFAEQRGLIIPIGDWVIKTACLQIQEWMSLGLDCKVSVNVSAMQLKQEDFVGKVFRTLTASGVPPRQLELEVTESILMENFDIALQSLKRLNNRGIEIAIDDFGTGYSSLSYLKNLPINNLKIDRTFIKDVCNNDNDKKIVAALIQMAHSLGMTVVAEGVEEPGQLKVLAQNSCDQIQGYLLSKPIPADQMTEMLANPDSYKPLIVW
jgi:diguanylate cyclase (GGDEF)-like protein